MPRPTFRSLVALALAFATAFAVAAQELDVPVETQVPILLNVLGFDRKVTERAGEPLRIGVLYQPRVRSSRAVADAFREAAAKSGIRAVAGRALQFVLIEFDDEKDLSRALGSAQIDAVYVTPLRAVRIAAVTAITRQRRITTLTGVPGYVVDGLTVGLGVRGQKPEILVNLGAHKAEGADFSAQLLKVARIIR
jgi:hypothetical protein